MISLHDQSSARNPRKQDVFLQPRRRRSIGIILKYREINASYRGIINSNAVRINCSRKDSADPVSSHRWSLQPLLSLS